ncbi:hypothetical protein EJ04DRAFT_509453 [Polyplosphaeria fusca]|uniref:Uncharacterized protein n=1 Tax=Polyplosphaeria fusca TaxID=682080 RepID=A0A9P4R4F4_9PLEO|nr:hypothetical protein EJ04DRAFT_509453 [Polyplosphaeria fusca]
MALSSRIGLCFLALLTGFFARADSTCYYPNGAENRGLPCNSNATVSACCGPGFICLSNGLCSPGPETQRNYRYDFYRSGCTDQSWNSTKCPQFCLAPEDSLDAGEGLSDCGNNEFCCARSSDCCSERTNIFTLGAFSTATTISYLSTSTQPSSASSTSTTASATSAVASNNNDDNKGNKIAIGVGVGVGIGVGGGLLVFAVLLVLRRRRKKQKPAKDRSIEMEADEQPPNDDSKESYKFQQEPGEVAEFPDNSRAHIPKEPQELAPQDRYELASPQHPGKLFKEDGVYRHGVPG